MKRRHALFLPTSLRIGAYAFVAATLMTVSGSVSAADAKADAKAPVQKVAETQPAKQTAAAPQKDAKASVKDMKAAKPAAKPVKQKTPQEIALEKRNARFAAVAKKLDQVDALVKNDYKVFDSKAMEKADKQLNEAMNELNALTNEYKDKDAVSEIGKMKNRCISIAAKMECCKRDATLDELTKRIAQAEMLANDENKKYNEALDKLKAIKAEIDQLECQQANKPNRSTYASQLKSRCEADIVCVREICGELLYQEAKEIYAKALKVSGTEKGSELAKEAKKVAYESRSLFYTGDRKASDAEAEANITKKNGAFAKLVADLGTQCDKIVKYTDFRSQTKLEKVDMTYFNRIDDIEKMLAKAEKQYRNKMYTQARKTCEEIFIRDPYNPDAVRLLDKVYRKLYFYAELRTYNEMLRNDAETIWSWVPAIPDTSDRKTAPKSRPLSDPLLEKINGWVIDVDFEDYNIFDIIREIRETCKKIDPQKIGLNIQTTPALSKEPYASMPITVKLKKTPVNVILDYVTKMCGVSWTTDRDGLFVTIGPDLGDHENRDIPMRVTVYRSITNKEDGADTAADTGKKDDGAWGGGGIAAGVEAAVGKRKAVTDQDLKRFFEERGILFDAQSSISYNQRTHLLSATNKREQLIKLENLVREIDVEAPLVMVEAKILEIQLKDQEELGFDWIITDAGSDKNWDYGMASPLRDFGLGANKLVNNLNVIPNLEMGHLKFNVNLTVTAVDRTDRVEILSTPKVVAKTGEEAEIKMARQMYFPESWSEPDTSNINGTSLSFQPSYPEFGDPRDVGLTFTVTPTVSSNNRTIELDLHPQVTDLTGWSDYSYDVVIGAATTTTVGAEETEEETAGGVSQTKKAATNSHITMKMPQISNREVVSKVKVEDGSTVLIGGLITDQQRNYEDKFPILGDIPVLGRLFSKVAQTKERVNLLISVAPRLISGDGQPLRENTAPVGVPDFYR